MSWRGLCTGAVVVECTFVVGCARRLLAAGVGYHQPFQDKPETTTMLRVHCVANAMARRQNGLLGMSPIDSPSKTTPRKDLPGLSNIKVL